MKTLRTLLREGDPVDHESSLAPADVDRMRRTVLAAAAPPRAQGWARRVALAAGLSVFVGLGAWFSASMGGPRPIAPTADGRDDSRAPAAANGQRRQVQFATPGGTRIIWVFDSNFSVR